MMKQNVRSTEEVVGIIKSVLVANKRSMTIGMSMVELDNEYREQDGIHIPFRALGYPCLLDFLECLQKKDEIVIRMRGTMPVVYPRVNAKIAHVSALVSGQKDSSKKYFRGGRKPMTRSYPRVSYPPRLDSNMLVDVLKFIKTAPKGIHISKIKEYLRDRISYNIDEQHLIRQLLDVNHEVAVECDMIYPISRGKHKSQSILPSKNMNSTTGGRTAQKKPMPAFRPAGISDSDDEDSVEFIIVAKKSESAERSPSKNSNQRSRMREESKAVAPLGDEAADSCSPEDENCHTAEKEDVGMLVSDRTKFRLEKLIQQHSQGIWCAELPAIYQKEYCIPLNYEDLGFGSVSDFAAHLPEIFHCIRLQDKGDFKLFDVKAPKPEAKQSERQGHLSLAALHNIYQSYCGEMEAVPGTLSSSTSQRLVPEGVMTVGETVAQIFVTELFHEDNACINVVVVDVITPSFFWIQLLKKTPRFKQFMTELHDFYSLNASKYVIPIVLLERGINCACIYDKKWHRGVIKTVKPDNTVTVMFYDYGTILNYPPHDIHFLHRSFSRLPAQAIPCGLFNVKPKSTVRWPYRICQEFVDKVLDIPLVAMLGSIDADNNSMLIALTNTEENEDFHINDWMVSSGYAIYGKMGDTVDMNEMRDDSLVITDVSGGTSHDVDSMSLISTLLGLDPATGGPMGLSTSLHTIMEEPNNFLDSSIQNVSSYNSAQTSPQILNCVIQQAKTILALESLINAAIANGFLPDLALDAPIADVNPLQSADQQIIGKDGELRELQNFFEDMSVNDQTQKQGASLEPPPIPPMPKDINFNEVSGNHGSECEPIMPYINGNTKDNINVGANFEKHDVNMNFAQNPFNSSTYSSASTFAPQFYETACKLSFMNDYQLRPDPAATNNLTYSNTLTPAHQAPATSYYQNKISSVVSQHSQFKASKSSTMLRQTFENSLEQSAKSFFERLEAKSKYHETNPFKVDIDNDTFHRKNWSLEPSPLPSRSPITNPFLPTVAAIQQEKISQTRVVYESGPVMYDLSSKDKAQSKRSNPALSVQTEQEAFEASKQLNVAFWIEQGRNPNANYVNNKHESVGKITSTKPFDCSSYGLTSYTATSSVPVNAKTDNVPPPIPPRPGVSVTKSKIKSEVCQVSTTNVQGTSNPVTRYIKSEWIQAAENAISFKLKEFPTRSAEVCEERTLQDMAAGGPMTVKIEQENTREREETVKRDSVSKEVATKPDAEVVRTVKKWDFREVQITKQVVYLIHIDHEGWLTVEEFFAAFTNYKSPEAVLKILDIQNVQIPFRFIQRSDYPRLFDELERTTLAVSRNHNNEIGDLLHLAPIKSILKILRKLKIVDLKEVELATKKKVFPKSSPALFDACTVITVYANLQQELRL